MLKNGQLPAFRVDSDWRFHREKIDQYLFAASNVVQTERAQNDGDKPVAASRPEKTVAPDREVWAAKQAQALRERRVEALDWDNLSRAIEILGRRGRSRRYPDVSGGAKCRSNAEIKSQLNVDARCPS
jgi:hypothetical protein